MERTIDYSRITNIQFDDIRHGDAPDYTDAFISSADYYDEPMTDEMLDLVNDDRDFVHDMLINYMN